LKAGTAATFFNKLFLFKNFTCLNLPALHAVKSQRASINLSPRKEKVFLQTPARAFIQLFCNLSPGAHYPGASGVSNQLTTICMPRKQHFDVNIDPYTPIEHSHAPQIAFSSLFVTRSGRQNLLNQNCLSHLAPRGNAAGARNLIRSTIPIMHSCWAVIKNSELKKFNLQLNQMPRRKSSSK
jgi:hypothetical protein